MHTPEIQALEDAAPSLSEADRIFAANLIGQSRKRLLTDKQLYWVRTLTARARMLR